MRIPMKDVSSFLLSILESFLQDRILTLHDEKKVCDYFNAFDKSIFELLNNLSEPYEQEQVHDYLLKNSLDLDSPVISEKEKQEFIDRFYNEHKDLEYIGSVKIRECLSEYIDNINLFMKKLLDVEGKIVLSKVETARLDVIDEIQKAKYEIINTRSPKTNLGTFQFNEEKQLSYNVGKRNKIFLGRDSIIEEIASKISEDGLVILTGASGMGKSQIANEIVWRIKANYGLVMWFSANSETELLNDFNTMGRTYGLIGEKQEDFNSLLPVISLFTKGFARSLIIYDGADDICLDILTGKCAFSNSDIIITTQNANVDADEYYVVVIDTFTDEEAKSFLMSHTNKRKQTELDEADVERLCTLLENYPLALEYARAYVNKTQNSFGDYIQIYREHKYEILNKALTKYQKTAYTAWKLSYEKIVKQSADAKEVLQMLSYIDAHEIPWYDIFEKSGCYTLHTLNEIEIIINNYSFFSKDGDIVDMHELTQDFIRLQMQRDNETEKYYEKILNIFSKILPDYITSASEKELCDRLIRHALALILNGKQDFESENMLYFATNTISKLYVLGYYQQTIEVSLKILKLNNTSTEKFRVFQTVTFLAQAYHYIGKDEEALCALSKYYLIVSSMEEMDASVKGRLLARYKNVEGLIQKDRGEWEICLNTFLEAKDLFDQMVLDEDNEIKSNLLNNIGITYYHLGQLDNALLNYEKASEYAGDSKHLLLRICGNMANTYRASNQLDKALGCYEKSLEYSIEVGDRRNECVSRNKIGNYYLEQGQYDIAEQYINKSLQLAEKLNFKVGAINAICALGNLAFHQQDYVTAKKYWEQSLKESCALGYRDGIENSKNFLKYLPT